MLGRIIRYVCKRINMYCLMRDKHIAFSKKVEISNVVFDQYVNVAHNTQITDSEIGLRTSVGRYSKIRNAVITKYCSIFWDVTIGAVSYPMNAVSTHAFSFRKQFGLTDKNIMFQYENCILGNDI